MFVYRRQEFAGDVVDVISRSTHTFLVSRTRHRDGYLSKFERESSCQIKIPTIVYMTAHSTSYSLLYSDSLLQLDGGYSVLDCVSSRFFQIG